LAVPDAQIAHSVPVSAALGAIVGTVTLSHVVQPFVTASIFKPALRRTPELAPLRQRYPAIPAEFLTPDDPASTTLVLKALRERVEIFSRDRGRINDSFVRVDDLIDLGLISAEDIKKLSIR
jgi:hypothetical protein